MAMDDPPLPSSPHCLLGPHRNVSFSTDKVTKCQAKAIVDDVADADADADANVDADDDVAADALAVYNKNKVQQRHQLLATLLAISVSYFHNYARSENL